MKNSVNAREIDTFSETFVYMNDMNESDSLRGSREQDKVRLIPLQQNTNITVMTLLWVSSNVGV